MPLPWTSSSSCASWPSSPPSLNSPSSTFLTCSSGVQTIFVNGNTNVQCFSKSFLQKIEASRSCEGAGKTILLWSQCLWHALGTFHLKLSSRFLVVKTCLCRPWMTWREAWQLLSSTLRNWQKLQMWRYVFILMKALNYMVGYQLDFWESPICDESLILKASAVLPSCGEEVVLNEGPKNPTHHRF